MYTKIILVILFAIISKYIYHNYKSSEEMFESDEHYKLVSDYFIGKTMNNKKPILWIFSPSEVNARNWENFYSRNTMKMNQPYLQITMKSIYDKCKDSFNICLIDDDGFSKLLSWNVMVDDLPNPIKNNYRQLGLSMILHEYGGMLVPQSFLCVQDLFPLYKEGLSNNMFILENVNHGVTNDQLVYMPDITMMGCKKKSNVMKKLIDFQEKLYVDKTDQPDFIGNISLWCKKQDVTIIDGMYIGVKKINNQPVAIQELLGKSPIDIPECIYGIYIPKDEILKRTNYNWFCRMSTKQVLESDLMISKYMLASY